MLRSRLIILSACFAGSCLLVVVLYFASGWMSLHPSGFLRKLPSHKIVGLGLIKLHDQYGYLAGGDQTYVYLGNWVNRDKLLKVNIHNKESVILKTNVSDTVKLMQGAYLRIDSTRLFLFDGNKPVIISGETKNGLLIKRCNPPYFTAAIPLSKDVYALRVVAQGRRNALVKLSNHKLATPNLLEQQGDGIFSTDGILLKTPGSFRIFYVYYYRNQFLALDTNLNIIYKGKTIDTVSHVHIKVAPIKSMYEITLASPPLFVNKQCAANDQWLFIHSALKADNEISEVMDQVAAIDIYVVKDGKYAFSVYLPNLNKEKLKDFRVYGNTLVALYDHYLYCYQLNF